MIATSSKDTGWFEPVPPRPVFTCPMTVVAAGPILNFVLCLVGG